MFGEVKILKEWLFFLPSQEHTHICALCVCSVTSVVSDSLQPWDYSPPASLSMGCSRHEYWTRLPFSFSRGSSQPRDRTCVSHVFCIAGRFFTAEPLGKPSLCLGEVNSTETFSDQRAILSACSSHHWSLAVHHPPKFPSPPWVISTPSP